ncbi:AraC family transcriptional regulator [Paenibacillus sp. CAU 1782]
MKKELYEAIQYPNMSFPFIMYTHTQHETVPKGRGFNDLHWHEELQITLATKGKLTIQVNGIQHVLETGQAIVLNKGVLHIITQLSPNGQYVSFNFPEKLLAFYSESAMEQHYVLPYTNSNLAAYVIKGDVPWQQQFIGLLREMKQTFDGPKAWGWEYEVSILTVRLWLLFIANISLSAEETSHYNKLQQERLQLMLSYIHQHYSQPVSLKEIADVAHLSVSECTRSFKKTVRMTPYDYLVRYRIKKSCDLLLSSDHTITEIAELVGFNHVNHFIQSFKKQHNQTPRAFRKMRNEPV